jgi:hypothetical protein
LLHRGCIFVPVDENQSRGAVHIAHGGNGAEQDGAVAAVEEREVAGLQGRSHALVHRVDHLEQGSLVEKAGQGASGRFGIRKEDVGPGLCAWERRRQPSVAQPCRSRRLPELPRGAVEAHADELYDLSAKRSWHVQTIFVK